MSNDRKSLDALINRLQYLSYSLGFSCGKTGRTLESTDLSNKVEAVRKELEAALSRPAEGDGWISVDERLPENGKPVLLDIGERHPVRAMYAAKYALQADPESAEDCCDYSEEHDEYYAHEGWYEWGSESETIWRMHNPIRWHELPSIPPPPTAGSGHGPYFKAIHDEGNGVERLELSELGRMMLTTDIDALPSPTAGSGAECRKCGGAMRPGVAIEQTYSAGAPDFPGDTHGVTMSPAGPGQLIDCSKCGACGWSVTAGSGENVR